MIAAANPADSVVGKWLDYRWARQSPWTWGINDCSVSPCTSLSLRQTLTLPLISELGSSILVSILISNVPGSTKPFLRHSQSGESTSFSHLLHTLFVPLVIWLISCLLLLGNTPLLVHGVSGGDFSQGSCSCDPGWPVENPSPWTERLVQPESISQARQEESSCNGYVEFGGETLLRLPVVKTFKLWFPLGLPLFFIYLFLTALS